VLVLITEADCFIFRGNEAEVPSDKSVLNLLITGVPIRPFRSRVGVLAKKYFPSVIPEGYFQT
jgi:hypothetical protein